MIANQDGANINSAVEKLKGILSEPSTPTDAQAQPQQQASQPEPESQATEPETLQSDTEAPSRRRKAKLGEREIELDILTEDVDPDEVVKGLMMESDYRKKTMSLADERKAFESKKGEFDTKLAELTDVVMMQAKDLDSPEMKELKEADPDSYWREFEKVQGNAEKLKAFKESRDKELLEAQQKQFDAETARYTDIIPEWLDSEAKSKDIGKMAEFLTKTGLNEQEIGSIYDARYMSIIRKAMLFDEISSKKLDDKRVKQAPKSSSPGSSTKTTDMTASQKRRAQLKKTGKINDAQAAIKDILNL